MVTPCRTQLRGFALPSVIVASVVMLMVLVVGLASVTAVRNALNDQGYNKIARDAAASGVRVAEACMRENDFAITWTNANPLRPNTNCNGVVQPSASEYVLTDDENNIRSTFSVQIPEESSEGIFNIKVTGRLERLRTSNSEVYDHRESALNARITSEPVYASYTSSGLYQVCVILSGHTRCNGANQGGQMGNGRVETAAERLYLAPEKVLREDGLLRGKTDKLVVSGSTQACIVTTDNEIYCWGSSGYVSLGVGYTLPNPYPRPIRVPKPAGMTGEITDIAMAHYSTCVVSGGDLWCWGRNHLGQAGIGTTSHAVTTPTRTSVIGAYLGRPVTNISSSPYVYGFCAVASGDAYCWGHNKYGQLGTGNTTNRSVPTAVVKQSGRLQGKTVVKVVNAMTIRTEDGRIDYDYDGQNVGTTTTCNPSKRSCYVQAHACALTTDGQVYCWGANAYGQMGQGSWSLTNQLTPIRVLGSLNGKFVRDLATSYRTPCALTNDPDNQDRLFCWGGGTTGAGGWGNQSGCDNTGVYTQYCRPYPVTMQTPGLANKHINSIFAGVNRLCAITEDGVNYCNGLNSSGQIGDGTIITRTVPTEAKLLRLYRPTLIY